MEVANFCAAMDTFIDQDADDPVCICTNQIENCEHFFFHCYLCATQRVALIARLREICSVDITTNLLLFGSNKLNSDVNYQIFELVESYTYESANCNLNN